MKRLVDTCIEPNIFCAFVCTNKSVGNPAQRLEVVDNFHSLLSSNHKLTRDVDHIGYYDDVEGINGLIYEIITSLKDKRQVLGNGMAPRI